jgi:Uma2 family endonuclease
MLPLRKDERYTYADYLSWDGDERWELVDGIPYAMAPPLTIHQRVLSRLHGQLFNFLKGNPCEVFPAPFGVRLNAEEYDDTVFEPDIVVVCDKSKLDEKGCKGAPDFVIEILSASTSSYDKVLKYNKYLQAGVREYWIVDPNDKTVNTYFLSDGNYVSKPYAETDTALVRTLPGCEIALNEIFTAI